MDMAQINIWGEEETFEPDDSDMSVDVRDLVAILRTAKRQLGILKRTLTPEQKEYVNSIIISFWNDSRRFLR